MTIRSREHFHFETLILPRPAFGTLQTSGQHKEYVERQAARIFFFLKLRHNQLEPGSALIEFHQSMTLPSRCNVLQ